MSEVTPAVAGKHPRSNDDPHWLWMSSSWYRRQQFYPRKRVPLSCCPTCRDVHSRFCSSQAASGEWSHSNATLAMSVCAAFTHMCSGPNRELASADLCQLQPNTVTGPAADRYYSHRWPQQAFINTRVCYILICVEGVSK